jgi:hypothetical protein
MECFHTGVVGLYHTAGIPHLHFFKNTYSDIFLDKSLLQLPEEEHPVNMLPFSKVLLAKITKFSSHLV